MQHFCKQTTECYQTASIFYVRLAQITKKVLKPLRNELKMTPSLRCHVLVVVCNQKSKPRDKNARACGG